MEQQLSLTNYENYRKMAPCLTIEQLGILRKQIKEVVDQVSQYGNKSIPVPDLKTQILSKKAEIKGLSLFLLDFQGFHDVFLKTSETVLKALHISYLYLIFRFPMLNIALLR